MSFYWILIVTVVFHLELTRGQNSGELYVLENPHLKELTCISDNDDAALVWNYDLSTSELTGRFNNFEPVKPIKGIFSYNFCAIWRSEQCWIKWYKNNGWRKTSALEYPMAPVTDYRWEGFKEYVVDNDVPQKMISLNDDDGTAIFSFRGTHDIRIHLCHDTDFNTSSCIVIKLEIDGKYSAIESCQLGGIQCHEEARTNDHNYPILDAYEWRTFRLQWSGNKQIVEVFRGINGNAFLRAKFRKWNFIHSIWISSVAPAGIRFHNYNYLLANKANAELTSEKFHLYDTNFCAKMLVSLCPDCHLVVGLIDSNTGETLIDQNIYGNVNYYSNGLRTWQSVKVILQLKNLSLYEVKLRLKTGLRNDSYKDVWWALDDIRICERNDRVRKSTIPTIAVPSWNQIGVGSKIKCQKLFHNEIFVADSSNRLPSDDICWFSTYIRQLIETRYSPGRTTATEGTKITSQPENLEVAKPSRGIVKLKWSYPSFRSRKMVRFHIEAHRLNTNLTTNLCTENSTIDDVIAKMDKQTFSIKLDVQTSTEYQLHMKTVDYCNRITSTARSHVSSAKHFAVVMKKELLSNFKEAVVELEVPAVANAAINTRVVVAVKEVSSCERNALEDLSPPNYSTKPVMERVIAEFPISSRESVNSTFDTDKDYIVEEMCNFQYPGHYWFVITLKDSAPKDPRNFNSSEVDKKLLTNQSEVWLVTIPVVVIPLLLLILIIWYRRHKKIPKQISHSPDVPFEPPYLIPLNWRVITSRARNNSSNSQYATIMDNSREQSNDAQDVSFPPLYENISYNSEEQANNAQNNSVSPLYANTSENFSEQRNLSQDVPSNSKVQTSHTQSVPLSPLYTNITYDFNEQTSHVQNIPDAPLYANTLNDSTEQLNHAQDHPYEPLYLKIIDY